jgi:microcompartment protein CcmK/EutM
MLRGEGVSIDSVGIKVADLTPVILSAGSSSRKRKAAEVVDPDVASTTTVHMRVTPAHVHTF